MIKSINVQNRFYMDLLVNGAKTIPFSKWCLISVSAVDTPWQKHSLITPNVIDKFTSMGCKRILPLQFDDCQPGDKMIDGSEPDFFDEEQAKDVIDFIDTCHSDKEEMDCLIHCHAGISRSGAIAVFTSNYLGIDFSDPYIRPNLFVLKTLWRTHDEQKGIKNTILY